MIFVTVGTHEQPFNRLVEAVDRLKEQNKILEEVVIQKGYSTYEPHYCKWSVFFSYQEMLQHVENARIVITHGGPSSFIMPLQKGKIPIVVPRQKQFGEHVNNHQVEFCHAVEERQRNIILAEEMNQLEKSILHYDDIIRKMAVGVKSNNERFIREFEKLVDSLFENGK